LEARQLLTKELLRGERLLWCGAPRQGIDFKSEDIVLIPFSVIWGGFAFFWEYSVLREKLDPSFWLSGIPFLLIGLQLIIGRFFTDRFERKHRCYGVTDQRILILSNWPRRKLESFSTGSLNGISFTERSDGGGDIVFGIARPKPLLSSRRNRPSPVVFELGDQLRKVYEIIQRAQQDSLRKPL
jgi:hypothetical protein